jgi:hypothetical protein
MLMLSNKNSIIILTFYYGAVEWILAGAKKSASLFAT